MPRVLDSFTLPKGVSIAVNGQEITVSGTKGSLQHSMHHTVTVNVDAESVSFSSQNATDDNLALIGTTKALINSMVVGVSKGFERKLELIGVGYKAALKGQALSLTLGFSHPVEFAIPDGIVIETPTATEILVKGIDKQLVGQVSANIRAYRPPEPYKGKGVRYSGEHIIRKETKKK
ncbi:MAG: 50S ribosomal protein L6 [Gammaproteobacteria bacterium]|nr:50S ribosomal protein L6 [Gammaproteobacteria bacterium]